MLKWSLEKELFDNIDSTRASRGLSGGAGNERSELGLNKYTDINMVSGINEAVNPWNVSAPSRQLAGPPAAADFLNVIEFTPA